MQLIGLRFNILNEQKKKFPDCQQSIEVLNLKILMKLHLLLTERLLPLNFNFLIMLDSAPERSRHCVLLVSTNILHSLHNKKKTCWENFLMVISQLICDASLHNRQS